MTGNLVSLADHRPQRCILIKPVVYFHHTKGYIVIADFEVVTRKRCDTKAMSEFLEASSPVLCGYPDARHAAYCDDECWTKQGFDKPFPVIKYNWGAAPVVGNVLITGYDSTKRLSVNATLEVEQVKSMIKQSQVCVREPAADSLEGKE